MKTVTINWGLQTRCQLLQHLIDSCNYRSYLEIGCDRNQVFDHIALSDKTGVDPQRGGTVRMTSDEFFAEQSRSWDLVFIDGLHEYQQVSRDVANAWSRLAQGGTIVIHDMLPTRSCQTGPAPEEKYWLGDVWRLGFDLAASPLDFRILTLDFGCGIIRKNHAQDWSVASDIAQHDWAFYEQHYTQLPLATWEDYFAPDKS